MIVQKQDGAFLYATTDLATIQYRMSEWQPDAILYVVDHRQSLHFEQLFAAARLWGYRDVELQHIAFGTVLGDDGRPFKTRTGTSVGLAGLLDEAVERALRDRLAERRRPAGAAALRGGAPQGGRADRHRRDQVRRPRPQPHQRLRLQLRQDAGHDRQHGHVHAVQLRPRAQHLRQGRTSTPIAQVRIASATTSASPISARHAPRTRPRHRPAAILRSPRPRRRRLPARTTSPPTSSSWPRATATSSKTAPCCKPKPTSCAQAACCSAT